MSEEFVIKGDKEAAQIVRLLQTCVSSDDSRPVLTCIHVEDGLAEATDSFRSMTVPAPDMLPEGLTRLKSKAKVSSLLVEAEAEEGTFPDVSMIAPKGEPVFSISINPKLLGEILMELRRTTNMVRLDFYGPTNPFVLRSRGEDKFYSLVMPMHDNDTEDYNPYD